MSPRGRSAAPPRRLAVALGLAGLAMSSAGCSLHSTVRDPLPPTVHMPRGFAVRPGRPEGGAATDRWWRAFGDPRLTAAVETAVGQNFQLRAAWARVRQADALGSQAASGYWPNVGAQLDYARRRSILTLPSFTDPDGPSTSRAVESDSFGVSLPVSYELDVWARVGSQTRAAALDREAARDDVEALAMTVAASVVETWLNVLHQRQLRALLEQQLATSQAYVELLDLRFREGLGSALDLFQQRGQAEALRAQLAVTRAQEDVAQQQLAVLLGRMPGAAIVPAGTDALPALPPPPRIGLPSELLARRPDIRAARRRIEAGDERVAAAVADRLPRFTLGGSVGFSAADLASLFESFVYSIAASVIAPLFDGGRRGAVVDQQRAVVWERTETLAHVMLTAVQEVNVALVSERSLREQLAALESSLESRRAALEEARQRFAEGLIPDYLNVLTALSAAQLAEQSVLAARRQVLSNRVQLHRALGGGWSTELEMPRPRRPVAGGDSARAPARARPTEER